MATPTEAPRKLHPTVLDTSIVQIAHVYAQALFDAAHKAGQVDAVLADFEAFVYEVLDKHHDFERALNSAIIGHGDKGQMLSRVAENRVTPLFLNFLLVLNDHSRLNIVRGVLDRFVTIRNQQLGLVPVEVRLAVDVDSRVEQNLRDRLNAVIEGKPVIHKHIDPDLLGGIVIRVGDTVYDGSLRTRLKRLREKLRLRTTHEIQSRRDQFRHSE